MMCAVTLKKFVANSVGRSEDFPVFSARFQTYSVLTAAAAQTRPISALLTLQVPNIVQSVGQGSL